MIEKRMLRWSDDDDMEDDIDEWSEVEWSEVEEDDGLISRWLVALSISIYTYVCLYPSEYILANTHILILRMTGVLPVLAGLQSDAIPRWLVALSISIYTYVCLCSAFSSLYCCARFSRYLSEYTWTYLAKQCMDAFVSHRL
jgi:hypothetical protein